MKKIVSDETQRHRMTRTILYIALMSLIIATVFVFVIGGTVFFIIGEVMYLVVYLAFIVSLIIWGFRNIK